jgi:chemotaxis protein CheD
MLKLGASKARLRAKVFGGSTFAACSEDRKFLCVGEVNQRFIHDFLALEGIAVEGEDLGGPRGRVIHFHTDNLKVFRRYIQSAEEDERILADEEEVWKRGVREAGREGEAILF